MEYTLLLLGLGLRELDMPASAIPSVKEIIRASTLAEARELAERALLCQTADEVEDVVFPYMGPPLPVFLRRHRLIQTKYGWSGCPSPRVSARLSTYDVSGVGWSRLCMHMRRVYTCRVSCLQVLLLDF